MSENKRWAKLAGLPKPSDKQQLDENFVGIGMVGNIFDREKEKYEDAFEHFLGERYEKEEVKEEVEDVEEIASGNGDEEASKWEEVHNSIFGVEAEYGPMEPAEAIEAAIKYSKTSDVHPGFIARVVANKIK